MGERFDPNSADYEVGYGKPPPEHQWQAGQSGNPFGRPPRQRSTVPSIAFDVAFGDEMGVPIRLRTGEERDRGTLFAQRVTRMALGPDDNIALKAMTFLSKIGWMRFDGATAYIRADDARRDREEQERYADIRAKIDELAQDFPSDDLDYTGIDDLDIEQTEALISYANDHVERLKRAARPSDDDGGEKDANPTAAGAEDDNDHLSRDDGNLGETNDPIVAPPQIKMVEPKPASPPDQDEEDQQRGAPKHDPDPPSPR